MHIWMIARDKSRHLPRDDANAVLFIDAGRLGTQARGSRRVLTTEDIERISGRLHTWRRSPRETPDEPGFAGAATHDEILANKANLDPRLYVGVEQGRPTTAPDMWHVLQELDRRHEETSGSRDHLWESVSTCERFSDGGVEPRRLPLTTVVRGDDDAFADSRPGQLLAGPSGSLIRANDYVDDGVPVVMPKDVTDSGFSVATIKHITERHAERLAHFRLQPGDVVLARRGELGRCAVVREEQQGWIWGTGCFVFRPPAEVDADYFAAYLRGPEARRWLEAHSTGSRKMKSISLDVLGDLPVVLPDLGTQRAIVDVMSRLDEHERLLREQLALTRKLRHDALAELLAN